MSWLFAQWYGLLTKTESASMRRNRVALVEGLGGKVLEVGVGNGLNLPHYAAGVHLTAVDYNRHMLPKAAARIPESRATVELDVADATALPFEADAFDHSLAGLVLCSVAEPEAALREMVRVTRPGGAIRLWEHVAAEPGWTLRLQRGLNPVWSRLGDGCRLDRDTVATAERAGMVIDEVRETGGLPRLLPGRLILGRSPDEGADSA